MISVKIHGLRQALSDLHRFQNPNRARLFKIAMRACGREMVKELKKVTPVRSGTMRKSETHRVKYYKSSDTLLLLYGVHSWYSGTWEGKPVIAHKIGHFVTGPSKSFTQYIRLTPGKSLVLFKDYQGNRVVMTNNTPFTGVLERTYAAKEANPILQAAFDASKNKALQVAKAKLTAAIKKL